MFCTANCGYNGVCIAGKGSYGAVYKARDLRTSEMVAIKVISLSEGVSFCSFWCPDTCILVIILIRHSLSCCEWNLIILVLIRRRDMRKSGVRLRCYNSVIIRMLFVILEAIMGKSIFG